MECMKELFLGYCFDSEGRYPSPVELRGVPAAVHYMNLQKGLHPHVMITNDKDECVMEAENGQLIFPLPENR